LLEDYKGLRIDLGSYQYVNIADWFTMICKNTTTALPDEYIDILESQKKRNILKQDTIRLLEKIYEAYTFIKINDIDAIKNSKKEYVEDFKRDYDGPFFSLEEELYRIKNKLSEEPFKFPVNPRFTKIALLEYVAFRRSESWDLWAMLDHLGTKLNFPITKGELIGLEEKSRIHASILFVLKEIFDYDDELISKYFGNFDT